MKIIVARLEVSIALKLTVVIEDLTALNQSFLLQNRTKEDPSLSELLQKGDSSLAEVLGKDSLSADSASESQAETTASQKSESYLDEPDPLKFQ